MKKIVLSAALFVVSLTMSAQVGINVELPEGALDVKSTTSGLVFPRVANTTVVVNAKNNADPVANGTMIYDLSDKCIKAFENGSWSDCFSTPVATAVASVESPTTGRFWMDKNLGATQVATSITDAASYGDYYQFGRATDGHEKITNTLPFETDRWTDANPPFSNFITTIVYWCTNDPNGDFWDLNAPNNPCPDGYLPPTMAELTAELEVLTSATAAFNSFLKIPQAGRRRGTDGNFEGVGTEIHLGTRSQSDSSNMLFYTYRASNPAGTQNGRGKVHAFTIRCIKGL